MPARIDRAHGEVEVRIAAPPPPDASEAAANTELPDDLRAAIDGNRSLDAHARTTAYELARLLPPDDHAARSALLTILARGSATRTDANGRSVLEGLLALAEQPRNAHLEAVSPPLDGRALLVQTLEQLADPLRIHQGTDKGTCGAATLEYMLATEDPGEFVRLVDEVTGRKGQARLRGGGTLRLLPDAVAPDRSGRTAVDRLLQSAIMDRAHLLPFSYENSADDGSMGAVLGGDAAVGISGFDRLYEDITGRRFHGISSYLTDKDSVAQRVLAAAGQGERVAVLTGFGSPTNFHWLSVEGVVRDGDGKATGVVLRNPWGWDDGEGSPPRQAIGRGLIRMRYRDFAAILHGAVLPADRVGASVREERPLSIRAEASTEYGAGLGVSWQVLRNTSLDASLTRTPDGHAHGSLGATVRFRDTPLSPTAGAHYHYSAAATAGLPQHDVEGRVGLDYSDENGLAAGAYVGVIVGLHGPARRVRTEAGAYLGWSY